jgi:tRNA dimethylallyltransferase
MYRLLLQRDPVAAAQIQPANVRRIVRALEVTELTGRPFSASMPKRELVAPTVIIGLWADRSVLDQRTDARVEHMWRAGLLGEVEDLLRVGLRDGFTASRAIGYAQAIGVIDGQLTEPEAVAETAQATRRYVRRQESWFRSDPRIRWVDATHRVDVDEVLALVR